MVKTLAMILAALFLSSLGAAAPPSPSRADTKAIAARVAQRADAIIKGDKTLFLSLLDPGDPSFLLEQSRWFDYRLATTIHDLSLEIESLEAMGPTECRVGLHLEYGIGPQKEAREVRYLERYVKLAGAWLDSDLAFTVIEVDHFVVKFDPGVDRIRAWKIAGQADQAWESAKAAYGSAPGEKTVLKLFAERELLRQNSKITVDRPFSGWAEPGESLKMWVRPDSGYRYSPIVAHELIHKVTLQESQNLCSWLAEGTANYFGAFPSLGGSYLDTGLHKASDYDRSLAWLASVDPETVADDATWRLYGGMSGAVVQFIEDRYGKGKTREIVLALARHPQDRGGYVYALHDATFRSYLASAVRTVLGLGMDELDAAWLAWIKARKA